MLNKHNSVKTSIKTFSPYLKKYKKEFLIASSVSLISAVASVLFTYYIALFLNSTINDIFNGMEKIDNGVLIKEIIFTFSILIIFLIVNVIMRFISTKLLIIIAQKLGLKMRVDFFKKIKKLSAKTIDQQTTGDTISCFFNDIDSIIIVFNSLFSKFLFAINSFVVSLILMLLINPLLGSIIFTINLIIYVFLFFYLIKNNKYFSKQQKHLGVFAGHTQEFINQSKVLKVFNSENFANQKIKKSLDKYENYGYKTQLPGESFAPLTNFFLNLTIIFMILIIVLLILFSPHLLEIGILEIGSVGLIAIFISISRQLMNQISNIFSDFYIIQSCLASINRFNNFLNLPNEEVKNKVIEKIPNDCKIHFKDVSFCYETNKPIIKEFSAIIEPNTSNAIIGPTGSGKTTIINLLLNFFNSTSGEIFLDDLNIKDIKYEKLYDYIAVVMQDAFIFRDTLWNNIKIGNPNTSDEEIKKVLEITKINKFSKNLENGLETIISNSNQNLSEGEKQLIMIARALLSPAKIVILDEATSYIDTKTEDDIKFAINQLINNKTTIIIAHKLSTIKNVQNIIVLKDGVMIEQGNHTSLMDKKGFYYELNTTCENDIDN
ncbi:MAG: ABC transporter ATP-binding protein [Mycoplasma sp.]